MPIIVKASFPKKNRDALFWGGEEVTCTIKITNSTSDSAKNLQDKKIKNVVVPPSNDVFVKSKSVLRRRKSIDSVKNKKPMNTNSNNNNTSNNNSSNNNNTNKSSALAANTKATLSSNNSTNPSNSNPNSNSNNNNNNNNNKNNNNNSNNNNNDSTTNSTLRVVNTNDESFSLKKLFRRSMSFLLYDDYNPQESNPRTTTSSASLPPTTTAATTTIRNIKNESGKSNPTESNEASSMDDTNKTLVQPSPSQRLSLTSNHSNSNISQVSTATPSNFASDISTPHTIITNFDYDEGNLPSAGPPSASTDTYSHNVYEIRELEKNQGTQINIKTNPKPKPKSESSTTTNTHAQNPTPPSKTTHTALPLKNNYSNVEVNKIELHSEAVPKHRRNSDASSQDSHITGSSSNTGSIKRLNNVSNHSLYSLDKRYNGDKVPFSMSSTSLNTDFEIKSYYNNSSVNLLENSINNSLLSAANTNANPNANPNLNNKSSQNLNPLKLTKETLSIGYIQVMGKCTLDGNHINLNLFESVKSKIRYGSKMGGGGSVGYDIDNTNDPRYNRVDIPIYSTAPGILFCNLSLEPGETKIFDYSIVLPTSLPPTYYGRSIKINYSIHIGIQKTPFNTTPYSITLPFKVFSYAEEDGSKPSYDILNPVIINKDLSTISQRNTESLDLIHSPLPYTPIETSPSVKIEDGYSFRNVCQLCQQASKVSYEICKDNENVAQLLFTRSVYRLGESIIGIIKFKTNALRCYQVTTYLETNEQIEYPYALRSKGKGGRVTKKVIAQQQDFCLNNSKIFVELPIPLYATPEFNIQAINLNWFLRFEFITSSNEKIMNTDAISNKFIHSTGITNSNVETFDCKIPIKVYGSKYGIQSSKANDFVSIYI